MRQNILMVGFATLAGMAAFSLLPAQEPSPGVQFKTAAKSAYFVTANTVTGAPYAADAVTETTQTLADGNRIVQSSSVKLYRDSQGRERQEGGSGTRDSRILITITDPVSNSNITLDPQNHTGQKRPSFYGTGPGVGVLRFAGDAGTVVSGGRRGPAGPQVSTSPEAQADLAEAQAQIARRQAQMVGTTQVMINGQPITLTGRIISASSQTAPPVTEQLGSKTIEGVFANGSRTTLTIPAGQIGNQQPIQVVDEAWYSPDLKMNIMTRHSDPRSGENVYRLTNISRNEPDPSLFQAPPDYKLTDLEVPRTITVTP